MITSRTFLRRSRTVTTSRHPAPSVVPPAASPPARPRICLRVRLGTALKIQVASFLKRALRESAGGLGTELAGGPLRGPARIAPAGHATSLSNSRRASPTPTAARPAATRRRRHNLRRRSTSANTGRCRGFIRSCDTRSPCGPCRGVRAAPPGGAKSRATQTDARSAPWQGPLPTRACADDSCTEGQR